MDREQKEFLKKVFALTLCKENIMSPEMVKKNLSKYKVDIKMYIYFDLELMESIVIC